MASSDMLCSAARAVTRAHTAHGARSASPSTSARNRFAASMCVARVTGASDSMRFASGAPTSASNCSWTMANCASKRCCTVRWRSACASSLLSDGDVCAQAIAMSEMLEGEDDGERYVALVGRERYVALVAGARVLGVRPSGRGRPIRRGTNCRGGGDGERASDVPARNALLHSRVMSAARLTASMSCCSMTVRAER